MPVRKEFRSMRNNGPLILGALIVALVIWLAVRGPELAPLDPLARAGPLRVDGEYLRLPYAPGTPGYPLGTDLDGRDMLSLVLWGIAPTLSMVMIVAAVRLALGTVIGLAAGWSQRWFGRLCDGLIRAALAIPVIMIALGGIAAVGVEFGIWAFVFGLSLTGWVEAARIIRERTAAVRKQVYIEAAHSLGAGDLQILFRHVLRQVLSLIWMLFAFEISSTLMLTAALGFLGYYIGGDVWVQVSDAVAEATSGTPELGQLLATTEIIVTRPWPLLTIGGVVFVIVLGFNLLGEGLRMRASHVVPRSRSLLGEAFGQAFLWVDDRILYPAAGLLRTRPARITIGAALAVLALGAGSAWVRSQDEAANAPAAPTFSGPIWGSSRGDAAGTLWLNAAGPDRGVVAWSFQDPAGFAGGPVVTREGRIIAASLSGVLYAFETDGALLWQTRLQNTPAAGPALDASGRIFVADTEGGLSAFSAVGEFEWRTNEDLARSATAAPVVGPDGWIYYPAGPFLQAVTPEGRLSWQVGTEIQGSGLDPAQLAGEVGFLGQGAIDLAGAALLRWHSPAEVDQYLVAPDGELYFRKGNDIFAFTRSGAGLETAPAITWDSTSFTTSRPQIAGAAPGGRFWLFYSSFARGFGFGEDTRLVWLDSSGEVLANIHYGTRNSTPVGIDREYTLYSCGNMERGYGPMDCQAFSIDAESPNWTLTVDGFEMAGAALAPGRLYVTTTDGYLHAIGAADLPDTPAAAPTVAQTATTTAQATEVASPGYAVTYTSILTDYAGFSGAPALAPDGNVLITSLEGVVYKLAPGGESLWQLALPANGVGAAVASGQEILVLDRAGLNAFSVDGEPLWRFEHDAGTAVAGPALGPDGRIYYTIQAGSRGNIQAVSPAGEGLWRTQVETFSYYRPPLASPNGQLIFFAGEVFDAASGAPVDLQLDFEPDSFVVGADRQLYILYETTLVGWTYTDGKAVLAEERIASPHELGSPEIVGVLENGEVWYLFTAAMAWFTPEGFPIHIAHLDDGLMTHFIGTDPDGLSIVCGRNRRDFRQNALPSCAAFLRAHEEPVWNLVAGDVFDEFTGGVVVPDGVIVALEYGQLFLIEYELEGQ